MEAPDQFAGWRGWRFWGKTWLLIVNTHDTTEAEFEFAFPKPVKAAILDLGEAGCVPKASSFRATLPPLGVALVVLEF